MALPRRFPLLAVEALANDRARLAVVDRLGNPNGGSTIHFAPLTTRLGINRACVMPIAVVWCSAKG
jgi:hypothetical protein